MLHRLLCCSLSVLSLSIAAAQAAGTYTLDTPRLTSIDNFRDVAGTTTTYTTSISFTSAAQAVAMMEQTNRSFVSDAGMRSQFATLFHCTASKDRTGWTAAVLLSFA